MDNWRKYMTENEDNLSIEDVDDKVWQNVSKAVPRKRSFTGRMTIAFQDLFQKLGAGKEGYTGSRRRNRTKLAYAFAFIALIIVSCTYKVKSYSRYGDVVSFSLAKNSYLLNHEQYSKGLFNSFSRFISPSDPGSFLFFNYIEKNDPEAEKIIGDLKAAEGISDLAVTPVVFEFKESLFSSLLYKAFEIKLSEARPDDAQVENKVKGILKEKGLNSVDIQIDKQSQDILFGLKAVDQEQLLQGAGDSATITKDIAGEKRNKSDTTRKPKTGSQDSDIKIPKNELPQWKKDLALMTELTTALEKEGLVDNRKAYKLEIKDGEFYINDKKQPKEITDKFRKYFRDDNYTIINNEDK